MRNQFTLILIAIILCACQPAARPTPTPLPVSTLTPTPTPTQVFTSTPTPGITPTEPPTISYSKLVWSPDSKWLAYANSQGELWLQTRDGKSSHVTLHEPDINLADLFWSPVGDGLLVLWGGLWLIPVTSDGMGEPKIIQDYAAGWVISARWSPNGKQVAFVSNDEAWLYENGQVRRVTQIFTTPSPTPNGDYQAPTLTGQFIWSPDGSQLYVELTNKDGNLGFGGGGLMNINLQTGKQHLIANVSLMNGFSPDRKMFLFRATGYPQELSDYYLLDSNFNKKINLTNLTPICEKPTCANSKYMSAGEFLWGPNGQYLYTTAWVPLNEGDGEAFYGFIIHASPEKIIMDHRGDPKRSYLAPIWFKDGRYAYLEVSPTTSTYRNGDWIYSIRQLWIEETSIPAKSLTIVQSLVAWAPDGSALAVIALDRPLSDLNPDENHSISDNVATHLEIIPLTTPEK